MQTRLEPLFRRCLSHGERPAHAFLRKYPFLVSLGVGGIGHNYSHSSPDFRLGDDYVCDFINLSCMSGWWFVVLIELESPCSSLYLKSGTESKSLRTAKRQITDWRRWIERDPKRFREAVGKLATKINAPTAWGNKHKDAEAEILDTRLEFDYEFRIVIGRRDKLSLADQQNRLADFPEHPETIATFDRLLDQARRFDQSPRWVKESVAYHHHW